jgi:hypothetical protein
MYTHRRRTDIFYRSRRLRSIFWWNSVHISAQLYNGEMGMSRLPLEVVGKNMTITAICTEAIKY